MAKQKKPPEPPPGAPAWMITWSDLVSLLMCFFVMMFALSSPPDAELLRAISEAISGRTPTSVIPMSPDGATLLDIMGSTGLLDFPSLDEAPLTPEEIERLEQRRLADEELSQMASDFKTYFAENELSGAIDIIMADDHILLRFRDGVLFDSGRADLRPLAIEMLDYLAEELLLYPLNEIKVEGHTDNLPINTPQFRNNRWLSTARALEVSDYFVYRKGIPPERVAIEGRGEFMPIDTNDTPEGRANNRRVEIKIMSRLVSSVNAAE